MPVIEHKRKAVFFDRDGVLNHLVKRDGSYYSPQTFKDFHIVEGVKEVVDRVHKMGYLAIVISNQPDISRGKLEQSELDKMTLSLINETKVDDVFYCIHDNNDDCGCRKPAPGLFFAAQKKYNIDFKKSFMIGDTWKDFEAAKSADISMILINRNYNQSLQEVKRINTLNETIIQINSDFSHENS